MQPDFYDITTISSFTLSALALWWALGEQRLGQLSPLLALALVIASNYLFPSLLNAGMIELAARWLAAFLVLRLAGMISQRLTQHMPSHMRYATQLIKHPVPDQPIEFEEVNS